MLIDRLLERKEFADYWATKWCDLLRVKSEYPINLWPNAVQCYHHWIRTCIQENRPYDRFVREMLTATGSNFDVPPVNFTAPSRAGNQRPLHKPWRSVSWACGRRVGRNSGGRKWRPSSALIGYKTTEQWKEEIVTFAAGQGLLGIGRQGVGGDRFSRWDARPAATASKIHARFSLPGHCSGRSLVRPGRREPHVGVAVGTRHHS